MVETMPKRRREHKNDIDPATLPSPPVNHLRFICPNDGSDAIHKRPGSRSGVLAASTTSRLSPDDGPPTTALNMARELRRTLLLLSLSTKMCKSPPAGTGHTNYCGSINFIFRVLTRTRRSISFRALTLL